MTTAAHHASVARPLRVEATLRVRWLISRSAVATARPDLVRRDSGEPVVLEMLAAAADGRWACEAALVDGGRRDEIPVSASESGAWSRDAETGLEHLEVPGVLHATYRRAGGGVRLLYVRTPLLAALGIPGGRYELIVE